MLIGVPLLLSMAVEQMLTCLATAGDVAGHHILAVQQAGVLENPPKKKHQLSLAT